MSIRDDYEKIYTEICRKQSKAVFDLNAIISTITDGIILKKLKELSRIQAFLYDESKQYFDSLKNETEKRKELRKNRLGTVRYKDDIIYESGSGKCIDFSRSGACIDVFSEYDINEGDKFNLWINLFDEEKAITRYGQVKWLKKIEEGFFKCGFQFQ